MPIFRWIFRWVNYGSKRLARISSSRIIKLGSSRDWIQSYIADLRIQALTYDLIWPVYYNLLMYQFSPVAQSCQTLCDAMDCSMPDCPVHHQLPELAQTHVHWDSDAIQPSHPLLSPSPPAFSLSQHERLFQWVSSLHQVAKILEFQLQHQSFQWIFRTDFL